MRHTRTLAVAVALMAIAASTSLPAVAAPAPADAFYVGADASAVELTLLGMPVGTLAGSRVTGQDGPSADAAGFGMEPAGDAGNRIGSSAASAESPGSARRDPETGTTCAPPVLPSEAGAVADLVGLVDVCSSSLADLDAAGQPEALATANAGSLSINGALLSSLLLDLLLDPVTGIVDGVVAPIRDEVIAPVDDALAAVCASLPEGLTPSDLVQAAEDLGLPVDDVIRALPDGDAILEAVGDDCVLSLVALLELAGVTVEVVEAQIRALLEGLLDRDLLTLVLGGSESSIARLSDGLRAAATTTAVAVSSPSLEFLVEGIVGHVSALVTGVITDVAAVVPDQLSDVVAVIPTPDDVLATVLPLLPLDTLIDSSPLLGVTLGASTAVADYKGPGTPVDTSDSTAGAVVVRISPAIAALLGIDAETTVASGVTQVIAEDTPLESTVEVGAVSALDETLGRSEVATAGARTTGTSLALLTGLDGGIVLDVGAASARAGGRIEPTAAGPGVTTPPAQTPVNSGGPTSTPTPTAISTPLGRLPLTGGSAALVLVASGALVAAALAARRFAKASSGQA